MFHAVNNTMPQPVTDTDDILERLQRLRSRMLRQQQSRGSRPSLRIKIEDSQFEPHLSTVASLARTPDVEQES